MKLDYRGARQVERTVKVATAAGVESDALTTEVYDRHGRLLSVTEPSGDANANVATSYGYDVGNRLTSVSTTAYVPGTGNVTQSRSFSYDRAGLLQSETHPELGASGNGSTSYPRYDSRGHLLRRIDGGNDLTFVYDGAERLTLVRETSGGQRTLKSFTYAGANATFTDPVTGAICTDNRKGRLLRQSRFNYVTIFGSPYTVELREGMTYCGRDGRLSRRTLDNYVNGAATPSESFVLPAITYDALGNVTSLGYPECTHAACGAPSPRTVTFSYSEDLLTAVGTPANAGQYAGSLTYHPNLMVSQVVHANALTDTYANDPNLMRRPASIAVTTSGGAVRWSTGAYAYDGAGNVKTIGTHAFTYDKVSRLKSANLYLEPNGSTNLRSQTFTYDAFGNLLAIGGHAGRNTPTTPGTNRLALASYDASGNVTSWNGNAYAYDPFNLMWNYRTGSDEWVYLYTADDERAWSYKTDNTSLWALRGLDNKVLREYTTNGAWSVASDYIHRDGALLAAETPQGLRHFHLDHLGTPRLISDGLGQQKAYHVYYPYGDEATAFNQDTIRAKFTGHERDLNNSAGAGDDLDYMHARFYGPLVGRFMSMDTVQGKSKVPQTWNRYTYTLSNPLKFIDSDGKFVDIVLDVGFIAYDLYDIGRSLYRGEGVSKTQGLALAADIGGAIVPFASGGGLAIRAAGKADELVDVGKLAARFAQVEERAGLLQRVIKTDGSLNVSDTVGKQLLGITEGKNRSFIPTQAILDTIGSGARNADPKKVANHFQYTAEATRNGSKGTLTVVVNEKTGQIVHVLFKSTK
ncbi:MAG TPA: RHS repeat-associated core domain-containing protein [Thermoanaerobaculia bacterium]